MFAIDGCKMPSNASKEWSGILAEMSKKQKKFVRTVRRMLAKHREEDMLGRTNDHTRRTAEEKNIEELKKAPRKIKKFCKTSNDRQGLKGKTVKNNLGEEYIRLSKVTADSGFQCKITFTGYLND